MSTSSHITWIVTASTHTCRFYTYHDDHLTCIKTLEHPECKLRDIELTADKPGHYGTSSGARGAYSQETDPKDVVIDHFALEIAKQIEHARAIQAYSALVLIALPHMNGLIIKHSDKNTLASITHNIEKNVMDLSEKELLSFLKTI